MAGLRETSPPFIVRRRSEIIIAGNEDRAVNFIRPKIQRQEQMQLNPAIGVRWSMKTRLVVISLMTLLIALAGCASRAQVRPAPQAPPTSAASHSSDDDVLDVMLHDLLTVGDSPLSVGKEKAPPATILLSPTPSKYPRTIDQVLIHHDKAQWAKLSDAQTIAAQEAAADLVARWHAKEMDPPFAPSDSRVKLFDAATTKPAVSRFDDRPVLAWRPGFSVDHQFAAVSLIIPWSMHHAEATYLLEMKNGAWTIILRQFVYFF